MICVHCGVEKTASTDNAAWCQDCFDRAENKCLRCGDPYKRHTMTGFGNGRCHASDGVGRTCSCQGFVDSGIKLPIWR